MRISTTLNYWMRLPNYFNNSNSVFFQSKNLDAKCNFSEVKKICAIWRFDLRYLTQQVIVITTTPHLKVSNQWSISCLDIIFYIASVRVWKCEFFYSTFNVLLFSRSHVLIQTIKNLFKIAVLMKKCNDLIRIFEHTLNFLI